MQSRRETLFLFLAVSIPVWLILAFLLSPTVTRGGDCGELIAASYRLGITHPSGYPVWCLLGRLFACLPLGEIAWRYNLFSSLCGGLASGFVALATYRMLRTPVWKDASPLQIDQTWLARWASGGTGFLFAGGYHIATQFIIAEVYAGAALIGAALLYLSIVWRQDGDRRDLFSLAFLGGLSLALHLSTLFVLPWVALAALWKRGLGRAQIVWVLAFGALGFTPVLYLPIRSAPFPAPVATDFGSYFYAPLDWGHPSTPALLKNHLTGAQYRRLLLTTETRTVGGQTITSRHLTQPPSEIPRRLSNFGEFTLLQYLWATPLLLVGLIASYRADKRLFWLLFLIALGNIGVEINYNVGDQTNFFFPAYLVLAIWMGLGWFVTLRFLAAQGSLVSKLGPITLGATIAAQLAILLPNANLQKVTRVRDGALEQAAAMQSLATRTKRPVSALMPADDILWAFWYAKYVLGAAPNVETPWGRLVNTLDEKGKLVDYIAQLRKHGPVCLTKWSEDVDKKFPLVMLSPSGNVCLASNRRLPEPAKPLSLDALGNLGNLAAPNGLLKAQFRPAKLWQGEGGRLSLAISDTAAFEADFSVPASWKPHSEDAVIGRLEVLMAPVDQFAAVPGPTQGTIFEGKGKDKRQIAFLQRRRLVLPARAQGHQLLRIAVPLNIETTASVGSYNVWTRIVLPTDTKLPVWTRTDRVFLTQK